MTVRRYDLGDRRRQIWDGSPAAGKSLCQKGGVETHRGGLYAEPHARGSPTRITSERPRGARMALKYYIDNETVRSRGQDLVSTSILTGNSFEGVSSCLLCGTYCCSSFSIIPSINLCRGCTKTSCRLPRVFFLFTRGFYFSGGGFVTFPLQPNSRKEVARSTII